MFEIDFLFPKPGQSIFREVPSIPEQGGTISKIPVTISEIQKTIWPGTFFHPGSRNKPLWNSKSYLGEWLILCSQMVETISEMVFTIPEILTCIWINRRYYSGNSWPALPAGRW